MKIWESNIAPLDQNALKASKAKWDGIAKPTGSLGRLETSVMQIAGLTGSAQIDLSKRGVLVLCADNGVTAEGVSQAGAEITLQMAGSFVSGTSSVCRMAAQAGAQVIPVDMGMNERVPGVLDRHLGSGTGNIACGAAMSREQAERALTIGVELVKDCKDKGFKLLATGEMGIGNTTTSSAVTAVLLGLPPSAVTGRGAGMSDEGLKRKTAVIERAIAINAADPSDPVDVLLKLGGFDIAGLAGVFLGGAIYRVPILIDGFISAAAALVASRIRPESVCAMLASHVSAEPAAGMLLERLGMQPLLMADMRLGEGTGAVCAMPILDMALSVYNEVSTFGDIGITSYGPGGQNL